MCCYDGGAFLKRPKNAAGSRSDAAGSQSNAAAAAKIVAAAAGEADADDKASSKASKESVNWDPSADMYDIGTFAQVQQIIRLPLPDINRDLDDDEKSGGEKNGVEEDEERGGVTLLLLGHRRLRKTHTLRNDPMVGAAQVESSSVPARLNPVAST